MYANRRSRKLPRKVLIPLACAFGVGLSILPFGETTTSGAQVPVCACSITGSTVDIWVHLPSGSWLSVVDIPWIPNTNVHLAMKNGTCINSGFSFTTKEYCPLGSAIESINGLRGPKGGYYELFVNGDWSRHGMDTALLHPGDQVFYCWNDGKKGSKEKCAAEAKAKWKTKNRESGQAKLNEIHKQRTR